MLKKLTLMFLLMTALLRIAVGAEKYAVLLTGQCSEIQKSYWIDTFLMWEMLTQEKGYDPDNVFVIFYDGDDWYNYEDTKDEWQRYMLYPRYQDQGYVETDRIVKYPATKTSISEVARVLQDDRKITEDDFLFVWTYDHGDGDIPTGVSTISLNQISPTTDDNIWITDIEFAEIFNPIPAKKKVYWMAQCASGGFGEDLTEGQNNVFFKPSCKIEESASIANDRNWNWDYIEGSELEWYNGKKYTHGEFNYHCYSSVTGHAPHEVSPFTYRDYYYLEYEDPNQSGVIIPSAYFANADGYKGYPVDQVVSMVESHEWADYHIRSDVSQISIPTDNDNIGYHTSLEYPTILLNECDDPDSYLFADAEGLSGVIGITQTLYVQPENELKLINSHTTLFEGRRVGLYLPLAKLSISNSIFEGFGFDKSLLKGDDSDILLLNTIYINDGFLDIANSALKRIGMPRVRYSTITTFGKVNTEDVYLSLLECNISVSDQSILDINSGTDFILRDGCNINGLGVSTVNINTEGFVSIDNSCVTDLLLNLNSGSNTIFSGISEINNTAIFVNEESELVIGENSELHIQQLSDLNFQAGSILRLHENSKIFVENGSHLVFDTGSIVELSEGAEIIVGTKAYLTANGTTFSYIDASGKWLGINGLSGSSIALNNVNITGAETGVKGTGNYQFDITNSTFTDCTNGINLVGMQPGYHYSIADNTLTGISEGWGITVTSSDGVFSRNNVNYFNIGVRFVMSSPAVSKSEITYNKYWGMTIRGADAIPMLINTEQFQIYGELNNTIEKNGYVSSTEIFPSAQIGIDPFANVYMRFNNVISSITRPGISICQILGNNPPYITISAQYNFWGSSEVNDDYFFDNHPYYTIDYSNFLSGPCGSGGIDPSTTQSSLPTESKILSNAIRLEGKENYTAAIKLYELIIRNHEDSPEYYVAMARLPYLYAKAELDNNELITLYDEALESENTTHKKFFKGMKVATHIKGRRFDPAITVAEEMKAEAELEEEIILADINIAIANMFKNEDGKSRSTEDYSKTLNDLLAKLNEGEGDGEKTDIVESVLPTEFTLYQNYPNPFNPTTEISYALSQDANVSIRVYSSNGSLIADLINASQSAGYHSVKFDASKLSNGVFYYSLVANGRVVSTKKMLLLK